jgi:hypothetical protein
MKECKKCKVIKDETEFHGDPNTNDGLHHNCKACHNKDCNMRSHEYYEENIKSGIKTENKVCCKCNKSKSYTEFSKRRYSKDGLCSYCRSCRSKMRTTKEERKKATDYVMNRYNTEPEYRLKVISRSRIRDTSKNVNNFPVLKALGCSDEEFKLYLEGLFYPNPITGEKMTWENQGYYGWHIHHIIPLSSFDFKDPEQFKKACHYTNLKPVWAEDHMTLHHG